MEERRPETIETLLQHRSIRRFREERIPETVMNDILASAVRSSTTGNMQVYSIVRTEDAKRREALHKIHFGQKMVLEAPVNLTFLADFNRFNKWCELRGAKPGYDNFLSFLTAAIDALLAAQNAAVAAEAHGLGICYVGTAPYQAEELIEFFGLPCGVVPVTALAIGYPAEDPGQCERLPMEAVVHRERYDDVGGERLEALYAEKEALPANEGFVAENGLPSLAHVFTEKRYPRKMNVTFSKKLLEVLQRQGFLNHEPE